MIIKSLSRTSHSQSQLIKYVCKYILRDGNPAFDKDATLIHRHNIRNRNNTIDGYIKQFTENESHRLYKRKNSVKLFHNIISFSPKDKEYIPEKTLKEITKKFVSLRGENNLYIAVAHNEKLHTHLHIVVSGTQLNGRSSRLSKQHFKTLKLSLEKFQQKFPELTHSNINHTRSTVLTKKEIIEKVKVSRQTDKQKLITAIEKAFNTATSKEEFLSKLKDQDFEPYFRGGKIQGVATNTNGRKYRFSRLGFPESELEDLEQKFSIHQQELQKITDLRNRIPKQIKQELPQLQTNPVLEKNGKDIEVPEELSELRLKNNEREFVYENARDL